MELVRPKSARERRVQDVTSDFKKTTWPAPFRSMFNLLEGGGSKGSLHREESKAVCPIKIGWEFLEIARGSETPTSQAEPFKTTKNRLNTFLAGF